MCWQITILFSYQKDKEQKSPRIWVRLFAKISIELWMLRLGVKAHIDDRLDLQ